MFAVGRVLPSAGERLIHRGYGTQVLAAETTKDRNAAHNRRCLFLVYTTYSKYDEQYNIIIVVSRPFCGVHTGMMEVYVTRIQ